MESGDKLVHVFHIVSLAFLSGYLTIEYIWPFLKRRFWTSSSLQRKLRLDRHISLTKHEEELAYGALHPDDIVTSFEDVAGHYQTIARLRQITELLLSPSSPTRTSKLFRAPSGILLYGPPGCGKTMIARALAKESGVRFIAVNLATVMDKWVGETEKYIEALFTLGKKIAPVIIFVDEIDALTRKRGTFDRDWSAGMKSQLLSFWDGLQTGSQTKVIIMGATNRPQDIDEAFLRRMPLQIRVELPTFDDRKQLFTILFNDLERDIIDEASQFDFELIAKLTEGLSGSDIHELARRTVLHCSLSKQPISTESFIEEIERLNLEMSQTRTFE